MSDLRSTIEKPKKRRIQSAAIILGLLLLYIWGFGGIDYSGITKNAWVITGAIMDGFLNPDWSYVYRPGEVDLISNLLETFAIALVGISLSVVLSFPIAFWAARNLSVKRIVSGSGKSFLSFFRTFPDMVMALLFIAIVGPGPYAGMLALGFSAVGMLGKLYAEEIESIDPGPTEALVAAGANKLQILWFAVVPQVLPGFISATLYRFEINMRSASTLGVVAAGGIGTPLLFAIQGRSWDRVGIILIGLVVFVLIIDLISSALRKKVV
ncbi:phosphonate ABC transporter, permease protein PhnE [Shouchella clausii]|uniref:Phosphonate ABC transporter, permease protein PhnE n=1 Tax=Shouchella clausii TaxID=79880 RepID=A0A268S8K1_SHOCL|nr:phosphonate ABC transporter, permease protein PhnE [Shouchella clausii]PAD42738.1 phosphonate ABC transporter, permease protein PhnE [Bacillus sp. 7520-S]MBU8598554.1 phosphonate ABC transporter, permease protein PhnE [Shouchella clausii]MEB5481572.1 phosphonate ABC transporter, permease protein PhnE [Shouchella clausii]MED4157524.1 phosphonate ABC transporter, permease protein PhnE [Shouchella clausii]MED4177741.1 phosphonate ABC transporter, permease protein PhnE [Shouchella clausii]